MKQELAGASAWSSRVGRVFPENLGSQKFERRAPIFLAIRPGFGRERRFSDGCRMSSPLGVGSRCARSHAESAVDRSTRWAIWHGAGREPRAAWVALLTLIVMEVVLGVDNLVFVSILSNKLPEAHARPGAPDRHRAGPGHASRPCCRSLAFIVSLTAPVIDASLPPAPMNANGHPASRPGLLLARPDPASRRPVPGLESHQRRSITRSIRKSHRRAPRQEGPQATLGFATAIVQILALDIVFSIDSILTAVGMTEHLPIMMAAVIIAVGLMLVAAGPLARSSSTDNPSVVMLALGFLLLIGATLIADSLRRTRAQGLHICRHGVFRRRRGRSTWSRAAAVRAQNQNRRRLCG